MEVPHVLPFIYLGVLTIAQNQGQYKRFCVVCKVDLLGVGGLGGPPRAARGCVSAAGCKAGLEVLYAFAILRIADALMPCGAWGFVAGAGEHEKQGAGCGSLFLVFWLWYSVWC